MFSAFGHGRQNPFNSGNPLSQSRGTVAGRSQKAMRLKVVARTLLDPGGEAKGANSHSPVPNDRLTAPRASMAFTDGSSDHGEASETADMDRRFRRRKSTPCSTPSRSEWIGRDRVVCACRRPVALRIGQSRHGARLERRRRRLRRAHMVLWAAYRQAPKDRARWRGWRAWFTAIALAEGIAWGWAPIGLGTVGRFDVELLVLLVTLAVAEGAMVAFGPYLPAFFALLLPATIPFTIVSAGSDEPLQRVSCILMLVFISGLGGLAITTNRSFTQSFACESEPRNWRRAYRGRRKSRSGKGRSPNRPIAPSRPFSPRDYDLRQPVHALGIFVGALHGVSLPPEGRRIVEQIEASTTAIDGLFSALLDISRLDAGVVAVQRRAFAIGPILDRICREYREEAKEKGVFLVRAPCAHRPVRPGPDRTDCAQSRVQRRALHRSRTDRGRLPPPRAGPVVAGLGHGPRNSARTAGARVPGVFPARQLRARPNEGPGPWARHRPPPDRFAGLQTRLAFPAGAGVLLRGDGPDCGGRIADRRAVPGDALGRSELRASSSSSTTRRRSVRPRSASCRGGGTR